MRTPCFFFTETDTNEIYTLSLHDALPIYVMSKGKKRSGARPGRPQPLRAPERFRSEERFSRNAETDLVCRLLLEKKKRAISIALANAGADVALGFSDSQQNAGLPEEVQAL